MTPAATLSTAACDALGTLQQRIVQRTWDRVRQLRVERVDGGIVVHGFAPSYYVKQLVLEAVRETRAADLGEPVHLNVSVRRFVAAVR
jgi:predicted solute-binding protein